MNRAADIIRSAPPEPARPWPRHAMDPEAWRGMAAMLAIDNSLDLLALWADRSQVYGIFRDGLAETGAVLFASVPAPNGTYPALSPVRPAAAWFERTIRDLWGHVAEGGRDLPPWLDPGTEPAPQSEPEPAEPARLCFQAEGASIVRLELRRGARPPRLAVVRGQPVQGAARFMARISGDSTVAHSLAFAAAVEAAAQIQPPPRAQTLRTVMAELERMANHLADLAAISDIAGFALLPARFGFHRAAIAEAAARAFGDRAMLDCVVPGGVATDMNRSRAATILRAVESVTVELPRLGLLYEQSSGAAARVAGAGVVRPQVAGRFAVGGVVGRASGRGFDARRSPGYPPYIGSDFQVAVRSAGDVDARLRVRMDEALESGRWIRGLVASLPPGPLATALPAASGEGVGVVEGSRGDIWHWVRLDGGVVADAFPRDTSWLQWPVLESIALGAAVAGFPLLEKSVNCSYWGMDL